MQRQRELAIYALEAWAFWSLSDEGYAPTSVIDRIGDSHSGGGESKSAPPRGVELPQDVANVIYVFHKMMATEEGAKKCHLIRSLYLQRKPKESIAQFFKRTKMGNPREYYEALREFAVRLDML